MYVAIWFDVAVYLMLTDLSCSPWDLYGLSSCRGKTNRSENCFERCSTIAPLKTSGTQVMCLLRVWKCPICVYSKCHSPILLTASHITHMFSNTWRPRRQPICLVKMFPFVCTKNISGDMLEPNL